MKDFFADIRNKMNEDKSGCTNCTNLEDALKSKNREIKELKNELEERERLLQESKWKYKEMKRKYKDKKKEVKENKEPLHEQQKFGSVAIAKEKLSLCRDNEFSKYVGDLLDICFGREVLSNSILKCPNKRTLKTSVLDADVVNDIICHTKEKFQSVTIAMVRAAIRQKLNTCHKAKKIK